MTDHYLGHLFVLINLLTVEAASLPELLERGWRMVAGKRAVAIYEKEIGREKL